MVEAEPRTSSQEQSGIVEQDDFLAFVYANWALNHNLSPDDPIDETLLTSLVARATELSDIGEADKSSIKLRIGALLADPGVKQAKFDEARDFKKRQKEIREEAARMRLYGQA